MKFETVFIYLCSDTCRAESIGKPLVRIGWTVEKLLNRVFWLEIPIGVVFKKSAPWHEFLVVSLKFLNLFRQAAPIELMWAEMALTVQKLYGLNRNGLAQQQPSIEFHLQHFRFTDVINRTKLHIDRLRGSGLAGSRKSYVSKWKHGRP